jgi:uncharacterized protein
MSNEVSKTQSDQLFYSSLVTEHIVPKGKDSVFKLWHTRLINRAKHHPGFIRADLCPPLRCKDPVVKWYSIVHFDSPEHLNNWVESSDRKRLAKSGQQVFQAYRFKSFTTGLEGWFSSQAGGSERASLAPPTWKQILAVVLGLYPVVMIQSKLFSTVGILNSWLPESAMLLNNLVTSTILSFVVMPFITRRLRFWLQPAHRLSSKKNDVLGAVIVATVLGIMVVLFHWF